MHGQVSSILQIDENKIPKVLNYKYLGCVVGAYLKCFIEYGRA